MPYLIDIFLDFKSFKIFSSRAAYGGSIPWLPQDTMYLYTKFWFGSYNVGTVVSVPQACHISCRKMFKHPDLVINLKCLKFQMGNECKLGPSMGFPKYWSILCQRFVFSSSDNYSFSSFFTSLYFNWPFSLQTFSFCVCFHSIYIPFLFHYFDWGHVRAFYNVDLMQISRFMHPKLHWPHVDYECPMSLLKYWLCWEHILSLTFMFFFRNLHQTCTLISFTVVDFSIRQWYT